MLLKELKRKLLFRSPKRIVKNFHKLYYKSSQRTWMNTFWFGVPCWKCPLDLWIYQEVIFEVKPNIIIECGTAYGGGSLFLASLCDLMHDGKVITIDIEDKPDIPQHERITYLSGSSVSDKIIRQVKQLVAGTDKVIVILDSDHSKEHVLQELKIYSKLVTPGSYIIVEDSNAGGHPVKSSFGPGPFEAIEEFLKETNDFIVDKSKEKYFLTFNPSGYLRKIK